MNALTIADINTAVNHEPRVQDIRLAEALGFERPRKIRELIERHREALERFGPVCPTVGQTSAKGGRPGKTYWLTKKQALFICTKAETESATETTIQMVGVFDEYLTGRITQLGIGASVPALDRAGLALMRIGGKTVTVDTRRFKVGPNDRVVRVHEGGHIDIGTIRVDGRPHHGGGARGYYEAPRKPRRGEPQRAKDVSDVCVVLGVVVNEATPERRQLPAPKSSARKPGKFEPGSDILKDLANVVRSAMWRMRNDSKLPFERALHETLEDVQARKLNPAAAARGAMFDYDEDRARTEMVALYQVNRSVMPSGARPRDISAAVETRTRH